MARSVKLWWGADTAESAGVLRFLFGNRVETVDAALQVITKMKCSSTMSITRNEMRLFASDLQVGKNGVRYSYHNFYTKLVRKLMEMGFVEKCVIWDPVKQKTVRVYQLKIQPITERPPPSGFVRRAWQVAKGWNDLVQSR